MPKTSAPALRAVGYIRVSTAEQASSGLGMEAQRTAITTACTQRGWLLEAHVLSPRGSARWHPATVTRTRENKVSAR